MFSAKEKWKNDCSFIRENERRLYTALRVYTRKSERKDFMTTQYTVNDETQIARRSSLRSHYSELEAGFELQEIYSHNSML